MEPSGKKSGNREITYHVGWRKGKIIRSPNEIKQKAVAKKDELHFIWFPMDILPNSVIFPLLCLLPIISFGISLWLVRTLVHHG